MESDAKKGSAEEPAPKKLRTEAGAASAPANAGNEAEGAVGGGCEGQSGLVKEENGAGAASNAVKAEAKAPESAEGENGGKKEDEEKVERVDDEKREKKKKSKKEKKHKKHKKHRKDGNENGSVDDPVKKEKKNEEGKNYSSTLFGKDLGIEWKPGQKKPTPPSGQGARVFYESLYKQNRNSLMAVKWCLEHGVLPREKCEDELRRLEELKLESKEKTDSYAQRVSKEMKKEKKKRKAEKKKAKGSGGGDDIENDGEGEGEDADVDGEPERKKVKIEENGI